MVSNETQVALARRLRQLREEQWDVRVTQRALAEAFGVSEALISSWENQDDPVSPPGPRLAAYATFFATRRSVEHPGSRLLPTSELDEEEQSTREALLHELTTLRQEAVRTDGVTGQSEGGLGGSWRFEDGGPVRIVCSELPPEQLNRDATPTHPRLAYGELYSFGNVDALFELHGHIRAANPLSEVRIAKEVELERDDYSAHLVVLGGMDWNDLTDRLQGDPRLQLPVRQVSSGEDPAKAYFETGSGDQEKYWATLRNGELLSDVGEFVRAPNPYNRSRTLSICRGLYSLGTYGAVRALTDTRFRDRNEEYLRRRFGGRDSFSVLMRVDVLNGDEALTPDWAAPTTRLHEWPE